MDPSALDLASRPSHRDGGLGVLESLPVLALRSRQPGQPRMRQAHVGRGLPRSRHARVMACPVREGWPTLTNTQQSILAGGKPTPAQLCFSEARHEGTHHASPGAPLTFK